MTYLIPHFLHIRIILNDDGVLDVAAGWRRCPVLLTIVIGRAAHAATVQENLECRTQMAGARFQMHTVSITVETFRENHAVEWAIEFDIDAHVSLLALHLQMLDLRTVVWRTQWPWILRHLIVTRMLGNLWRCTVDWRL